MVNDLSFTIQQGECFGLLGHNDAFAFLNTVIEAKRISHCTTLEEAIGYINQQIESYEPSLYGYAWDEEAGPRIQLEPQGYRGYMEAKPVSKLKNWLYLTRGYPIWKKTINCKGIY